MDNCAHHSSMCGVSSRHLCSLVPSLYAMLPCHLDCSHLWPTGGSRRKLEEAGRGGVIGHSFSLVNWHIQKEEVSSSSVLQWQLQMAWVTLAAVRAVIAAATPQQQAPPPNPSQQEARSSALLTHLIPRDGGSLLKLQITSGLSCLLLLFLQPL